MANLLAICSTTPPSSCGLYIQGVLPQHFINKFNQTGIFLYLSKQLFSSM